ncbi:MAG TPA: amidohydrolase family protein, partial [Sphingomonadales bacterium]|nr:amidohydrolase family protein [Sphingomonadales bacterium]
NRKGYLDFLVHKLLPALRERGLVDMVDAYLERIAFTKEEVSRLFAAARALGLPVRLHADQLSDTGGAALAAQWKALSADHLEYASARGIKAMGKSGTVAVLLPGAFFTLREKRKPPVELMRRHKVAMALATDSNPGTSPTLSLRLMMNMGCTLFGLTPEEALAGVTRNAAQALGLEKEIGTLEKGKAASLAVWSAENPAELSYWLGGSLLDSLILEGKPVIVS